MQLTAAGAQIPMSLDAECPTDEFPMFAPALALPVLASAPKKSPQKKASHQQEQMRRQSVDNGPHPSDSDVKEDIIISVSSPNATPHAQTKGSPKRRWADYDNDFDGLENVNFSECKGNGKDHGGATTTGTPLDLKEMLTSGPRVSPEKGELGLLKNYTTKERFETMQSESVTNGPLVALNSKEDLLASHCGLSVGDCASIRDGNFYKYMDPMPPRKEKELIASFARGDVTSKYKLGSAGSKHKRDYTMFWETMVWERTKTQTGTNSQEESGIAVFNLTKDQLKALELRREAAQGEKYQ